MYDKIQVMNNDNYPWSIVNLNAVFFKNNIILLIIFNKNGEPDNSLSALGFPSGNKWLEQLNLCCDINT